MVDLNSIVIWIKQKSWRIVNETWGKVLLVHHFNGVGAENSTQLDFWIL